MDAPLVTVDGVGAPGRVAVIGGGVAGLVCARTLREQGIDVVVFDKGRAPGGRVTSHRSAELEADLGAQYFTVRDERFARAVSAWERQRVVTRWQGRVGAMPSGAGSIAETAETARFVGTPNMTAIAEHLARDLDVRTSHRVDAIARTDAGYRLTGAAGPAGVTLAARASDDEPRVLLGAFDTVLVCLPADQASPLLRDVSPRLADAAGRVRFEPCLALAFALDEGDHLEVPFDGLFVGREDEPDRRIAWIARDSSKPERRGRETWVIHAAPEWSRARFADDGEAIERDLLAEAARCLGRTSIDAKATVLRRWALARAASPLAEGALFDHDATLGMGGDWCAGSRVEGAFLSGLALARSAGPS